MIERFKNSRLAKIILGMTMLGILVPASASAIQLPNVAKNLPTHTFAATSLADKCTNGFLGLEPWFKFLPDADFNDGSAAENPGLSAKDASHAKCDVRCFNLWQQNAPNQCGKKDSDMPLVLVAIVDDLLRIAGIVTIGFVLYGAIQYVTSQGDSQSTARAQGTIINALIGMAIAMISVLVVSYIGNSLSK